MISKISYLEDDLLLKDGFHFFFLFFNLSLAELTLSDLNLVYFIKPFIECSQFRKFGERLESGDGLEKKISHHAHTNGNARICLAICYLWWHWVEAKI